MLSTIQNRFDESGKIDEISKNEEDIGVRKCIQL